MLRTWSGAQVATPESASAQTNITVTSRLFQPAALAAGDRGPLIVGFVLSMLMPDTVAVPEFPALSTAVPVACCAAPSVDVTIGWGQVAI